MLFSRVIRQNCLPFWYPWVFFFIFFQFALIFGCSLIFYPVINLPLYLTYVDCKDSQTPPFPLCFFYLMLAMFLPHGGPIADATLGDIVHPFRIKQSVLCCFLFSLATLFPFFSRAAFPTPRHFERFLLPHTLFPN